VTSIGSASAAEIFIGFEIAQGNYIPTPGVIQDVKDEFAPLGIIFEDVADPSKGATLGQCGPGSGRVSLFGSGSDFPGCGDTTPNLNILFVDPNNPANSAFTTSFSILNTDGLVQLSAFDIDGNLLGSTQNFSGTLSLSGIGQISRVNLLSLDQDPTTMDDIRYEMVTPIPNCFVIDAIDDPFSVINDGATADFVVLANDECRDDTPISVVELPGDLLPDRGGSATTDGDTVSYTPAAEFVGFEEFTYTAQDAGLNGGDDPPAVDQDTATVVVNVLENLIPDAVDDVATTLQDQDTIIDVLANDTPGNLPNAVEIEAEPANGSATLQADDTIRYSPNFDFFGEDTFEYRLTDANGDSDVATVTVGVFFVSGPQVPIDIMPNSDGNNLNLRAGQGAGIDVAILSVGEFFEAPNEIDPLTLKFGPREGNIWGSPQVRDVDGDGDEDLVVKFLIQQTGIPCGATHAILFGRTFDFQSISGMDTINTFNCPRVRKRH
jgi:hypothetical protein